MSTDYAFTHVVGSAFTKGNLAFDPDGRVVVPYGNRVAVVNVRAGASVTLPPQSIGNVVCIDVSPDGIMVVAVDSVGVASFIHTGTGHLIETTKFPSRTSSVSFSPNGSFVAAITGDAVHVFTVPPTCGVHYRTVQCVRRFHIWSSRVSALAWSPCGQMLIGGSADTTIRIVPASWRYNPASRTRGVVEHPAVVLAGHRAPVLLAESVSALSTSVISVSEDYTVIGWHVTPRKRATVKSAASALPSSRFRDKATLLQERGAAIVAGDDDASGAADSKRARRSRRGSRSDTESGTTSDGDGSSGDSASSEVGGVAADAHDRDTDDAASGPLPHEKLVHWRPEELTVAPASVAKGDNDDAMANEGDAEAAYLARVDGTESVCGYRWTILRRHRLSRREGVTAACFRRRRGLLAIGFKTGAYELFVYDHDGLASGTVAGLMPLRSLTVSMQRVTSVNLSPAGDVVVFGAPRLGQVVAFDWRAEQTLMRHERGDIITAAAYAPATARAPFMATGAADGRVRVWRGGAYGTCDVMFASHTAAVTDITVSTSGAVFSASSDGSVRAYDAFRMREFRCMVPRQSAFNAASGLARGATAESTVLAQLSCVAVDTLGEVVAAGATDHECVWLWATATGQVIDVLRGHTGAISSVDFSPLAPVLASASWDGTVRLWPLYDEEGGGGGTSAADSVNLGSDALCCRFAPDGAVLAAITVGGTLSLVRTGDASDVAVAASVSTKADAAGGYIVSNYGKVNPFGRNADTQFETLTWSADGRTLFAAGRSRWIAAYSVRRDYGDVAPAKAGEEGTSVPVRFDISLATRFDVTGQRVGVDGGSLLYDWRAGRVPKGAPRKDALTLECASSDEDDRGRGVMALPGVARGQHAKAGVQAAPRIAVSGLAASPDGKDVVVCSSVGTFTFSTDAAGRRAEAAAAAGGANSLLSAWAAGGPRGGLSLALTPATVARHIEAARYTEAIATAAVLGHSGVTMSALNAAAPTPALVASVVAACSREALAHILGVLASALRSRSELTHHLAWAQALLNVHAKRGSLASFSSRRGAVAAQAAPEAAAAAAVLHAAATTVTPLQDLVGRSAATLRALVCTMDAAAAWDTEPSATTGDAARGAATDGAHPSAGWLRASPCGAARRSHALRATSSTLRKALAELDDAVANLYDATAIDTTSAGEKSFATRAPPGSASADAVVLSPAQVAAILQSQPVAADSGAASATVRSAAADTYGYSDHSSDSDDAAAAGRVEHDKKTAKTKAKSVAAVDESATTKAPRVKGSAPVMAGRGRRVASVKNATVEEEPALTPSRKSAKAKVSESEESSPASKQVRAEKLTKKPATAPDTKPGSTSGPKSGTTSTSRKATREPAASEVVSKPMKRSRSQDDGSTQQNSKKPRRSHSDA